MKILFITDTHFGCRNNSPFFLNVQKQYFETFFFPYIDANDIKYIVHGGDVFDNRTNINVTMLDSSSSFFLKEIEKRSIKMDIIIGNHDCPFRNTNYPNSPRILITNPNIEIFEEPTERKLGNVDFLYVPWVNSENSDRTKKMIEKTTARFLYGHLEIKGFQMLKNNRSDSGFERKYLSKFDKVFSGHFHHRSTEDNIMYLGNPYETQWADYGNQKGIHIFDTEKLTIEFVPNPVSTYMVVENENDIKKIDKTKIVEVDLSKFEKEDVIYDSIEKIDSQPQSIVYSKRKIKLNENTEESSKDIEIKQTDEIIKEYIDEMADLTAIEKSQLKEVMIELLKEVS